MILKILPKKRKKKKKQKLHLGNGGVRFVGKYFKIYFLILTFKLKVNAFGTDAAFYKGK